MVTEKQEAVLNCLPDTRENIAEELGVSRRAIRYRMKKLEEEHGYEFYMTNDDVWHETEDGDIEREDAEPWRVDSYKKAHMTKEINNSLTELEKEVKEALSNAEPVTSDYERTGSSTLVLPHSDSHIGAIIEERHGVDYYSADEAKDVVSEYFDRAISYGSDAEDVVLVMNGDHLDGEGIYPHQRHEQEDNLRDQLRKAGHLYIEQILKLSDEFEHVWVYCIPGNHGKNRSGGSSNKANYDDLVYYNLQHATDIFLEENGDVDVRFQRSDSVVEDTFPLRAGSYTGYLCHGQHMKTHVGTSSGQKDALSIVSEYGADIIFRGHYHMNKVEDVNGVPVVMTGSIKPGGPHEKTLQAYGPPSSAFYTVTDDEIIENVKTLTF